MQHDFQINRLVHAPVHLTNTQFTHTTYDLIYERPIRGYDRSNHPTECDDM